MRRTVLLLLGALTCFAACRKDPALTPDGTPEEVQELEFEVPTGWPAPVYRFDSNAVTPARFALGRKLFYDPILSKDFTISCGSCHQPEAAFANADHRLSHGVEGRLGTRNSPGLSNMAWSSSFMWDGGVNNLEVQPISPIQNHVEMDLPFSDAVARVAANPEYQRLFKEAYGVQTVTSQPMLRAMAQFMAMLVSNGSKWDAVQKGSASFTAPEAAGQAIFQQRCASCHVPPLFTDFSFRNNGLTPGPFNDSGRAHITREAQDLYRFKVPSLRNLSFSAPYFHDGRAETLDAALGHYADSLSIFHPGTDPRLQGGVPLNAQQRGDLIQFLRTLDDPGFTNNKAFQARQD